MLFDCKFTDDARESYALRVDQSFRQGGDYPNPGNAIRHYQDSSRRADFHIAITNRIPVKIGVIFGFGYELENVPAPDGVVETVLKSRGIRPLRNQTAAPPTGFTDVEKQIVKSGRVAGWTGYELDHDYELALGEWEFEMQFAGQTVCKQKFMRTF